MTTPHALVAGAAGFLGSHLCDALLAAGWRVTGLDNLLTGRRRNLAHLAAHPAFRFVEADAADARALDEPTDLVLHFASPASPPHYLAHPIETLRAGSVATEALLDVARRDGARFLLASTSEVYGDPLEHPQSEGYAGNVNPIGPRSVYDEAKRYAEALTAAYRRHHGVDTAIARLFNTYGPRMDPDDGRAVPAFVRAALRGDDLPVHGDGSQTRSLTYVDDLVRGVLALAADGHPGPMNLGNPREQTVREIAELVRSLTGSSSAIVELPRPVDDPQRRRPDITLARSVLNWNPDITTEDGLARTIAWFTAEEEVPGS